MNSHLIRGEEMIRRINLPPYTVDEKVLRRFDQRQTVFGRMLYDEKQAFSEKGMYENVAKIIAHKIDSPLGYELKAYPQRELAVKAHGDDFIIGCHWRAAPEEFCSRLDKLTPVSK